MWLLSGLLGLLVAGVSAGFVDTPSEEPDDAPEPDDTTTTRPLSGDEIPPREASAAPSAEDDILWGDLFDDMLEGLEGDDQINGFEGADVLDGGDGDDRLWGDAGDDTLDGGAADDSLSGGDGDDLLDGGAGADHLSGGFGADTLSGGDGADSLTGGADADLLDGGAGDDTLFGASGDDSMIGGAGRDEIFGNAGDDWLDGLAGEGESGSTTASEGDFLNGGEGADTLMTGSDDWSSGGEDGDLFALGEWIDPAAPATIADFDAREDQIAVVYDPDSAEAPDLSLEPSDTTEGATWIVLNGIRLAEVLDAPDLSLADILLVTPSEFAQL